MLIFFPLGLLTGIVGLALWPLFLWGTWRDYPLVTHARLMIEGFVGAFVVGFVGIAAARLLALRRFRPAEAAVLVALHVAGMSAHLAGQTVIGDTLFLALILLFSVLLGARLATRRDSLSSDLILVGAALLSAVAGVGLLLAGTLDPRRYQFAILGGLLLHQGFVLFPLLNTGAFLLPRLSGETTRPGKGKALFAPGTAIVIVASFVIEWTGAVRWGGGLRFAAVALYLASQSPGMFAFRRSPFLHRWTRVGLWLLLGALLWPVFLPLSRAAGWHILFIGGFMLITLTVGARIIFASSGQNEMIESRPPFLVAVVVMLMVGLASRVGADFAPASRNRHLIYAALLGIAALLVWGIRLLPRAFVPLAKAGASPTRPNR